MMMGLSLLINDSYHFEPVSLPNYDPRLFIERSRFPLTFIDTCIRFRTEIYITTSTRYPHSPGTTLSLIVTRLEKVGLLHVPLVTTSFLWYLYGKNKRGRVYLKEIYSVPTVFER